MRISDWSSDVCSSDLLQAPLHGNTPIPEPAARTFVESLAQTLQASILLRANNPLANHFVATPLATPHAHNYGTLPLDVPLRTDDSRVGKECGTTFRSRLSPYA